MWFYTIRMTRDKTPSVISTKESSRTKAEQFNYNSKYNKTDKLVPLANLRMEHSAPIEAPELAITHLAKAIQTMETSARAPVRARIGK